MWCYHDTDCLKLQLPALTDEWEDHALVVSHLTALLSNYALDHGYVHAKLFYGFPFSAVS